MGWALNLTMKKIMELDKQQGKENYELDKFYALLAILQIMESRIKQAITRAIHEERYTKR